MKLKENHYWRTFHSQLMATVANIDVLDVLNLSYQPDPELVYNIFIQCINIYKGNFCVHADELVAKRS
jgi:hypothetical protein